VSYQTVVRHVLFYNCAGEHGIIPHLSCWECQAEGVDQGAERGEAGLDRLDMRERDQVEPGQEQARGGVGLEEQAQVIQVLFPAAPRIPGGMGLERSDGRWRFGHTGWRGGGHMAQGGDAV